jgi:hypothetical protein
VIGTAALINAGSEAKPKPTPMLTITLSRPTSAAEPSISGPHR